jgi:hypothetical protein
MSVAVIWVVALSPQLLKGQPVGAFVTVTFEAPAVR